MSENEANPTTIFTEQYGIKFKDDQAKWLDDFLTHQNDIYGNVKYRMFNSMEPFKEATSEHTVVIASRLRPTHVELVVREYEMDCMAKLRWLDIDYGTPSFRKISRLEDDNAEVDPSRQNIIVMSITTIDGPKIDKRYEICIYNPELDLVTDSIRFV